MFAILLRAFLDGCRDDPRRCYVTTKRRALPAGDLSFNPYHVDDVRVNNGKISTTYSTIGKMTDVMTMGCRRKPGGDDVHSGRFNCTHGLDAHAARQPFGHYSSRRSWATEERVHISLATVRANLARAVPASCAGPSMLLRNSGKWGILQGTVCLLVQQ